MLTIREPLTNSVTHTANASDLSQDKPLVPRAEKLSVIRTALSVEQDGLSWPGKSTRTRASETEEDKEARVAKLSSAVHTILECLGEDPDREGLLRTPQRYAKAMLFFTKGYEQNLYDHEGMISIGYIPNGRVLGLSKLARIAEIYARRLQVQERLTRQLAEARDEVLKPQGVAVVMESR
ncbi:hypothetical protein L0F63_000874 [Massospora cicadina]|nr:hypothetical protein L0F63_000874 [Massospora cicadina]